MHLKEIAESLDPLDDPTVMRRNEPGPPLGLLVDNSILNTEHAVSVRSPFHWEGTWFSR